MMSDDLEIDVEGIPIPWWLASMPDQVTTISWDDIDGKTFAFTFEAFLLVSGTSVVHCTYPRRASMITRPDPDNECHWTCPEYDNEAMIEHAKVHLRDALTP
jgi:hypothetical protein